MTQRHSGDLESATQFFRMTKIADDCGRSDKTWWYSNEMSDEIQLW